MHAHPYNNINNNSVEMSASNTCNNSVVSANTTASSIERLSESFAVFAQSMESRMSSLETKMDLFLSSVTATSASNLTASMTSPNTTPAPNNNTTTNPSSYVASPEFRVEFGAVETVWHTKRTYPTFEARVVDINTGLPAGETGLTLNLGLVSGFGNDVTSLLGSQADLNLPVGSGRVDVSGLKFTAVSSHYGNYFQFTAQILRSGVAVSEKCLSPQIQVKSDSVKRKAVSLLELSPDSSLELVPGVGKQYLTKFAANGVRTIRDLAQYATTPQARQERLNLLAAVRHARGSMTEGKLSSMIRDAHAVMERHQADTSTQSSIVGAALVSQPNKRQKTLSPCADAMLASLACSAPAFDMPTPAPSWALTPGCTMSRQAEADAMMNQNEIEDFDIDAFLANSVE